MALFRVGGKPYSRSIDLQPFTFARRSLPTRTVLLLSHPAREVAPHLWLGDIVKVKVLYLLPYAPTAFALSGGVAFHLLT